MLDGGMYDPLHSLEYGLQVEAMKDIDD